MRTAAESSGANSSHPPAAPVGAGLRTKHYAHVLTHRPRTVGWFEVITENFLETRGRPRHILERVRADYPVGLHGVSLSIGSGDPLRPEYLNRWVELVRHIEPFIVSDHLCWTGAGGHNTHDLLPLAYTEENLQRVCERVDQVQNLLGRRFYLENPSSYVGFTSSTMSECEFLREMVLRSGCGLLVDLNNIFVSARNFNFDAGQYLRTLPRDCAGQFHLAGHDVQDDCYIDTHRGPTPAGVWDLYREALDYFGASTPTLVEWDTEVPAWETLEAECVFAESLRQEHLAQTATGSAKNDRSAMAVAW